MTVHVEWDNEEKTVIRTTYQEPVKIEDVFTALDQQVVLLDSVEHPVVMMIDMSTLKRLPHTTLSSYPEIAKHRGIHHPNTAMSYVVMNNLPMEYMINIFSRLFAKFDTATSVEQARERIAERSRTLTT